MRVHARACVCSSVRHLGGRVFLREQARLCRGFVRVRVALVAPFAECPAERFGRGVLRQHVLGIGLADLGLCAPQQHRRSHGRASGDGYPRCSRQVHACCGCGWWGGRRRQRRCLAAGLTSANVSRSSGKVQHGSAVATGVRGAPVLVVCPAKSSKSSSDPEPSSSSPPSAPCEGMGNRHDTSPNSSTSISRRPRMARSRVRACSRGARARVLVPHGAPSAHEAKSHAAAGQRSTSLPSRTGVNAAAQGQPRRAASPC